MKSQSTQNETSPRQRLSSAKVRRIGRARRDAGVTVINVGRGVKVIKVGQGSSDRRQLRSLTWYGRFFGMIATKRRIQPNSMQLQPDAIKIAEAFMNDYDEDLRELAQL